MGLFLRDNSFFTEDHEGVLHALEEFWTTEGHRLAFLPAEEDDSHDAYTLFTGWNGWTQLSWTRGWEWDLRRRAQLHVSRALGCPGLLTFVHDGDMWGYELFDAGVVLDQFVHWCDPTGFFPGKDTTGRPEVLVAAFPTLSLDLRHAAGYLSPFPEDEEDELAWDTHVRPGDRWTRGNALVFEDFWRFLGIAEPRQGQHGRIVMPAPVWRRFTVGTVSSPRPTPATG
ncbi:hypothetical protein [Streptomyces sp. NPDC004788]